MGQPGLQEWIKTMRYKVGDKVRYQPPHFEDHEYEFGVVKEVPVTPDDAVRVVYACNDDWDNYQNYTGCLTMIRYLIHGWEDKKKESLL